MRMHLGLSVITIGNNYNICIIYYTYIPEGGAIVQWLKLPVWKVGNRGFKPRCGIRVLNKQNVSFLLTRQD